MQKNKDSNIEKTDSTTCTDYEKTIEPKKTEETLRISEELFSKMFKESPLPIAIARLSDGLILDVNDAYLNILGFTREEAVGKTSTELGIYVNPNDREQIVQRVMESGRIRNMEMPCKKKKAKQESAVGQLTKQRLTMTGF